VLYLSYNTKKREAAGKALFVYGEYSVNYRNMTEAKWALITGSSNGIGLEISKIMAADGVNLVIVARNKDKLEDLQSLVQEENGVTVLVKVKDLTRSSSCEELYNELQEDGIFIEYLVNNAGVGLYGSFYQTDLDRELDMLDLNIRSMTHLTKLFLKAMMEKGRGKILNVASTAAFQPGPMMAVYFASKAYVLHFSEALAHEFKGSGVSVTSLCPGPTETAFFVTADMDSLQLTEGMGKYLLKTAHSVARAGYRAMKSGKRVAIPGIINKLMALSVRFSPRKMVTRVTGWLTKRAAGK